MLLGDPLADPESQACSVVALGGVEGLEEMTLHLGTHAGSGIRDSYAYTLSTLR